MVGFGFFSRNAIPSAVRSAEDVRIRQVLSRSLCASKRDVEKEKQRKKETAADGDCNDDTVEQFCSPTHAFLPWNMHHRRVFGEGRSPSTESIGDGWFCPDEMDDYDS